MRPPRLRELLGTPGKLVKLAGAHDALGARLAVEAGFDGVWASSLGVATSNGVPDGGALTAGGLLEAAASMAAAVAAPVVADCQTGFGNVEAVRVVVRQCEAAGVQGVCIEDGVAPARNGLLPGCHGLAQQEEFAAKVEAARRARGSPDLLVLAQVQALAAGRGQAEALGRARAYAARGADAVVILSRSPTPAEVLSFVDAWDGGVPLVLIPTTYHALADWQALRTGKVRMLIYASQGLRAAVSAMKHVFRQILEEGTSHQAEAWLAGLEEVFALQGGPGQASRRGRTPEVFGAAAAPRGWAARGRPDGPGGAVPRWQTGPRGERG
jgi:phosphoenolpyruvate phosphomutase